VFDIYQWSEPKIIVFVLVFLRCVAFLIAYPIFGSPQVPVHLKVLLPLMLAFIIFPVIWLGNPPMVQFHDAIIWMAIKEMLIGILLGSVVRMIFLAVNIGGEIVSAAMGLSAGQIFNPTLGAQSTVIEQFQFTIGTMIFLGINGHHFLLAGIVDSFTLIPLNFDGFHLEGVKMAALLGQQILTIGLKMGAPVMISIFLIQVGMGIIGRVVPQINVLVTSLHLTILIGLLVMMISVPMYYNQVSHLQDIMADSLMKIMKEF
jgi:flagellar biosynthetic protein FliR